MILLKKINVYVGHHNEYVQTPKYYENVYSLEYDCADNIEFLDLEEVDNVDYKLFDNNMKDGTRYQSEFESVYNVFI